jgi:hypothetical protein
MEMVAAVAIGLNPYVASLLLVALAASTERVPDGAFLGELPSEALLVVALLLALAVALDLVLGHLVRFAPRVRQASQLAAVGAGAVVAGGLTTSELPLPVGAAAAAVVAWAVAAALTATAARASRSPAWIGLGHVPVLMAAATAAATIVPLGLVRPPLGAGLAATAATILAGALVRGVLANWRAAHNGAQRFTGPAPSRVAR